MGDMGEPLTDEQIAEEEKFLAGLPRVNLGALFLAPVWGPAHGMWAAFLFFVIAFAGIGVCLYFRRNRHIWELERGE